MPESKPTMKIPFLIALNRWLYSRGREFQDAKKGYDEDLSAFINELTHPNPKYKKVSSRFGRTPFFQQWQLIAGALFLALAAETIFIWAPYSSPNSDDSCISTFVITFCTNFTRPIFTNASRNTNSI